MGKKFPQELLSAYFDGEIDEEERGQAERLLAQSAAAQREVDEYGQIGSLLRSLPQESAPPEFRASVMQAAERAMLLPVPAVANAMPRSRRSRWYAVVASLTAVAALVVVLVLSFRTGPAGREIAMSTPDADLPDLPEVSADRAASALAKRADDDTDEGAGVAQSMPEPEPAGRLAGTQRRGGVGGVGGPAGGSATSLARTVEAATETPTAESKSHSKESWQFAFKNSQLTDAQVGQVVEAMATSKDQVAVVKLTVVDRQRGLESLQLLLARNRIEPQPNATRRKPETWSKASSDRLLAVYVETDPAQLSSALLELQEHEDLFRELAVDKPIQVGSLDLSDLGRVAGKQSGSFGGGGAFRSSLPLGAFQSKATGRKSGEAEVASKPAPMAADGVRRKAASGTEREKGSPRAAKKEAGQFRVAQRARVALEAAPAERPASQVAAGETQSRQSAPSSRQPAPTTAKSAPAVDEQRQVRQQQEAARGSLARGERQVDRFSRQLALSVPADLVADTAGGRAIALKTQLATQLFGASSDAPTTTRGLSALPTAQADRRLIRSARSLQVLFVLVPNQPASVPPADAAHPSTSPEKSLPSQQKPDSGAA